MNTRTTEPFSGQSLSAIIQAGLVNVKTATLEQSPAGAKPREDGQPALGYADNDTKRLFFYHLQLIDEYKTLARELKLQIERLFGKTPPRNIGAYIVGLLDGSKRGIAERVAALKAELDEKLSIITLVANMYHAEVRRRNPELQGWPVVTLHKDWSYSGSDMPAHDLHDLIGGIEGLDGLADIIGEMFGGEGGKSPFSSSSFDEILSKVRGGKVGGFSFDIRPRRHGDAPDHGRQRERAA